MKNTSVLFLLLTTLLLSSLSVHAQKVRESDVHEAVVEFFCNCSKKQYDGLRSDWSRGFLREAINKVPSELEAVLESYKNSGNWADMAADLPAFAEHLMQNCFESDLDAMLKQKFKGSEKIVDKAQKTPMKESDRFFWFNGVTSPYRDCEYILGLQNFMMFMHLNKNLFDDLGLDLDLNLDDLDLDYIHND